MDAQALKGNDPDRWNKLLQMLDEKLQFGLLDHLRRAASYHFEHTTLYIEASSHDDYEYLNRPHVLQQLSVLAEETTQVQSVSVRLSPD